jgi:GDP-mannose 6-dehydrogenase
MNSEFDTGSAVSVFGLGYVGSVSGACLALLGHRVVGHDINPAKVERLRNGSPSIVEERIVALTESVVASGRFSATSDARSAVLDTDISLICVGTPSAAGGGMCTTYLEQVTAEIGDVLAEKDGWHVVAYRSTMVPGTCEQLLIPLLEKTSGKQAGVDFGVCVNPEFLREATSVRDFFEPSKTIVGETDPRAGEAVMGLYKDLGGARFRVPIGVAEMAKYVDNSFHALKVGFANEVGAVCAGLGLDSHDVMDIFLADTKLNISTAYLRPGFAFGGSCLPKDLRALTHVARHHDIDLPLLSSLLASNETHIRRAVDMVIESGQRKIGIFGVSFKPGTDDLRESPMVELAQRLIGMGFNVKIHDKHVVLSRLAGANRAYIEEHLPHIGDVLVNDVDELVEHSDVLIIGSHGPQIDEAMAAVRSGAQIIDLVRVPDAAELRGLPNYRGIGW